MWAVNKDTRLVRLTDRHEGPWVPLRWIRRVLIEWRVIVMQSQAQWRGEAIKRLRVSSGVMCSCEWCEENRKKGKPLD